MKSFVTLLAFAFVTFGTIFLNSCSKNSASAYDATKPSAIIGVVKTAISTTGTGMGGSAIVMHHGRSVFSSSDCDTHGAPKSGGNQMANTNTSYPGTLTYCKFATNDGSPDTVAGAFETPRGISCAVERAGITWDGNPHDITLTLDTNCFTQTQLDNMGVTSALTATVTGSAPAAFNSYFDRGLRIQVTSLSVDYILGTKVSGSKIEFLSQEGSGTSRAGAFAGSFDTSTGDLHYEGRMERFDCTDGSSCGWERHLRAYAKLTVDSSGTPTGLTSISFGYMNIQKSPVAGELTTADGALSTGIKARQWVSSSLTTGGLDTIGNWSETTNPYCYTSSSSSATGCGTGLPLFTSNTKFLLHSADHTSTSAFANAYAGMTFTTVDVNTDVQN